jgi:ABC-type uncharacterized transport system substrate-binding protein
VRRIGVLMAYAESDSEAQAWIAAFREGLQKLGWTEGRNISLDVRWATGERAEIERFAKELFTREPELILASTTPATAALLQQTRTIPIEGIGERDRRTADCYPVRRSQELARTIGGPTLDNCGAFAPAPCC